MGGMKVNILRFQRFVCPIFISPKQYYTCFCAPFFRNMKITDKKIWFSYFISSDALVFFGLHLNYSSAAFECTMHEMPITKSSACKYRKKTILHTLLPYISGWRVFSVCVLFFFGISGERRNPALENSRPVKRIMSTISKHSEEAEDDEICSGNLWIINEHFEWNTMEKQI